MLKPTPPAPRELKDWRQAVLLVRSRAPTLAIAHAQVVQASARARQALAQALPQLTLQGVLSRHLLLGEGFNFDPATGPVEETIPDPATRWQGNLSFRQPVLALSAWHNHGTARRTTEATKLSAQDVERRVLAEVANTVVNVITAERLAEVTRVNLQSALSTVDLTERRARLGAAAALDVLRSQQEVALSRANVVQADEAVRRAREALGQALGDATGWGVSFEIDLNALALGARKLCEPTPTADERADIRAAETNVEIAQRNRTGANLLFAPTFDLLSDLTHTSGPNTANGEPVQWTVSGVLTWPLYDGGLRYGVRGETQAGIDIARAELDQVRRQAAIEIEQARRSVSVAHANLQVSVQSRDIATATARLANLSFLHGTGTSFDVVEAARRKREAELDLVLKQFGVVQAQISALLTAANCRL